MWQDLGGLGSVGVNSGGHQADQFGTTGKGFTDKFRVRSVRRVWSESFDGSMYVCMHICTYVHRVFLRARSLSRALFLLLLTVCIIYTRSKQNGRMLSFLATSRLQNPLMQGESVSMSAKLPARLCLPLSFSVPLVPTTRLSSVQCRAREQIISEKRAFEKTYLLLLFLLLFNITRILLIYTWIKMICI